MLTLGKSIVINKDNVKVLGIVSHIYNKTNAFSNIDVHILNNNENSCNYQFIKNVPYSKNINLSWEYIEEPSPTTTIESSKFKVVKTLNQALNANTPTKISYQSTFYDSNQEFDINNNRFTSSSSGIFLINTNISLATSSASTRIILMLYINGIESIRIYDNTVSSSSGVIINETSLLNLNAGQYLETYITISRTVNISPTSYFAGVKL